MEIPVWFVCCLPTFFLVYSVDVKVDVTVATFYLLTLAAEVSAVQQGTDTIGWLPFLVLKRQITQFGFTQNFSVWTACLMCLIKLNISFAKNEFFCCSYELRQKYGTNVLYDLLGPTGNSPSKFKIVFWSKSFDFHTYLMVIHLFDFKYWGHSTSTYCEWYQE